MIGQDKICAVVAAADARSMWTQFRQALPQTRTIELRLDWLRDDAEITRFLARLRAAKKNRATLIATCRRRPAGGLYRGTVAKQLLHLAEAIRAGCAWYDLDIETSSACPPELLKVMLGNAHRIASVHYFRRPPSDYEAVISRLSNSGADVIKIAAQCDSFAQTAKLLSLTRSHRNVVAIPMGELSSPTRILALRGRNGFGYAPISTSTAPGQTSLPTLKNLYRADRLNAQTQIYGVIGDPIGHSLSPHLHNAGFQARRVNAVYSFRFWSPTSAIFSAPLRHSEFPDSAVTIPHKQTIIRHLDDCDPSPRDRRRQHRRRPRHENFTAITPTTSASSALSNAECRSAAAAFSFWRRRLGPRRGLCAGPRGFHRLRLRPPPANRRGSGTRCRRRNRPARATAHRIFRRDRQ